MNVPVIDTNPFEELYLDLDGVFADMARRVTELTGRPFHELTKKEFWRAVYSVDDFFYQLELMPDALVLWEYVRQYRPKFLTGEPSSPRGREHKRRWVAQKFGPEWTTIVLPSRNKQRYSGPNKVIIDDTAHVIESWVAKGGHGIHHDGDVWRTIERVEELRLAYGPKGAA